VRTYSSESREKRPSMQSNEHGVKAEEGDVAGSDMESGVTQEQDILQHEYLPGDIHASHERYSDV
jgi:hypothetical protein